MALPATQNQLPITNPEWFMAPTTAPCVECTMLYHKCGLHAKPKESCNDITSMTRGAVCCLLCVVCCVLGVGCVRLCILYVAAAGEEKLEHS